MPSRGTQNGQPPFPNSERGKVRGPNQIKKKQRSFLKEEGQGCASDNDPLGSGRRGAHQSGASQDRKICTKFKIEEDEDQLRANREASTPSKILRILQNDSMSRLVCEALEQKYKMRLERGFKAWLKFDKLTRLQSKKS